MCGIAGVFNKNELNPNAFPVFRKSLGMLGHRGPDGRGVYVDDYTLLGQTRLSIIDLEGGHQPIGNEDGSLWLVCNGEIFNYIELRQELLAKGHKFSTHTDVEVVLHLYEEYGEKLFDHLNGQFAFAIWDKNQKSIMLARDHVGICPLHYQIANNQLYFASEIKLFLPFPELNFSIDPEAMLQTLTFWSPLPGNSIFKNIKEVKPGHYIKFNQDHFEQKPYWQLSYPESDSDYIRDVNSASEELTDLLEDSVRIRLRADVPVGAYLSGGLDSSITTALVKTGHNNKLRTFSIGFEDKAFDESEYQKLVSNHLETDHSAFVSNNEMVCENLQKVIWHTEKPVLRTAPVPLFLLSKFVRESDFKVVLTGEGADEFFSGYNIYRETKVRWFNAKMPGSTWRPRLYEKLYPYIATNPRTLNYWIQFFQKDVANTSDLFYSHRLRWNNRDYLAGFLTQDVMGETVGYNPVSELEAGINGLLDGLNPLERAHFLEAKIFLSGYLLSSQGDRMTMGNSVEGRYPFLDKRVIDFANRLAPELKLKVLNEKWILKHTFKHLLPDQVINRPKQPYRAPVRNTLLADPQFVDTWLDESRIRNSMIFDADKISILKKRLFLPNANVSAREEMALMAIITTEMLKESFINNKPTVQDQECRVYDYRSRK